MTPAEIYPGKTYLALLAGKTIPVHVLYAKPGFSFKQAAATTVWTCRNEITGREITIKDAAKFKSLAPHRSVKP